MRVVVTGGCGFIGSHQVVVLLEAGHDVLIIDDLSNSRCHVLDQVAAIAGRSPEFAHLNILETEEIHRALSSFRPDAMLHFAGMKHVAESRVRALDYHEANVGGLLSVLRAAKETSLRKLVFSSSASIYGETNALPIPETHPHNPSNPYSASKSMGERVLGDLCSSEPDWSVIALRYFNPSGAHPSGLLGEDPMGPSKNLLPKLLQACVSPRPVASVCGDDFNTPDGSGVRDYIHVMDVVETHLLALDRLTHQHGFTALNVGRGEGTSVLELISAVEQASGKTLEVEIGPRRPGDVSSLVGDTSKARQVLGPMTYRSIQEICNDAWNWQRRSTLGRATICNN
ncbi:MAG: UDP-glucose 4-epimerase GalE [Actinomycetia bacterium]|nr:UDP-glucose 4-epimerase GalE [Actinomycetes bacterium]